MKKFKSTISILLAVIMLFSALPFAVGAADTASSGQCGDNVYWTLDSEGTLTISGEGDMWDYSCYSMTGNSDYELPPYIHLDEWGDVVETITNIVIEDGVTSIGSCAFYGCCRINNVEIPKSVTSIGDYAFYTCFGIKNADIPNNVTYIGNNAFDNCGFETIDIPGSVKNIGNEAFADNNSLKKVILEDGISNIGEKCFYRCRGIRNIIIPKSVSSIGNKAIGWDYNEEDADIDLGTGGYDYKIDDFRIFGCKNSAAECYAEENEIIFNNSIDESKVYDVKINDPITVNVSPSEVIWVKITPDVTRIYRIYSTSQYQTEIYSLLYDDLIGLEFCDPVGSLIYYTDEELPLNLQKGKSYYFAIGFYYPDVSEEVEIGFECDCEHLNTTYYDEVEPTCTEDGYTDGEYCEDCQTWLYEREVIPATGHVDENEDNICDYCYNMIITEGQCGDNAYWHFDNNSGTLTISGSGDMWNYNLCNESPFNDAIKNIVIDEGITSIGDEAFSDCNELTSVIIPNSVTSIGNWVFDGCYGLTNVAIPNSVTSIGHGAFYCCGNLTDITIPNSVTSIGENAFSGCGITSIEIPDSVTNIGAGAFNNCYRLTSVEISNSVTKINDSVFRSCDELSNVIIPESVVSIGKDAFLNCDSLKQITIPKSVKNIADHALGYLKDQFGDGPDMRDYYENDGFTINGYTGSEAERYANDNGFKFNSIGSEHIHSYVSSVTKSPTCTEDGVRTYTCSCGDSYTEKISATGHETEHVEIPSTCTVCGVSYDVCTKCSETFNYTVLPLAEHTFGEFTVTKQPTYTQEGEREAICTVCGFKITESIAKLVATNESKDDKTGISVGYNDDAFEEDIALYVTEVFDGMSFNVLNNEKGNFKNELFDIVIKSGDENVQPNTSVLVSIPLPDGYNPEKTVVYYVTNDGRLEKLDSHYENGYIVFEASHFSHYALVDEGSNISNPTDNCDCICHKTGFVGFIYKIVRLFWKLFKINKTCSCGAVHY